MFELLILTGRPASGKSEILEYLRRADPRERLQRFHIGEMEVIDDFPMLWVWFEEDRILEQMGKERLHTTPDGYFLHDHLWDLLIRRLCLEYRKLLVEQPHLHDRATVILEFSRGGEHGGYARAFRNLSEEVARRAALLYVRVRFEESLRKNRRRFNPEKPHSLLEHGLPEEKLERLYRRDDWEELAESQAGALPIAGHQVPYGVFENEDDVTTAQGPELGRRLEQCLGRLWDSRRGLGW